MREIFPVEQFYPGYHVLQPCAFLTIALASWQQQQLLLSSSEQPSQRTLFCLSNHLQLMDLKKFFYVHSSYKFVGLKVFKSCSYQFLSLIHSLQFMPFKFIPLALLPQLLEKNRYNLVVISLPIIQEEVQFDFKESNKHTSNSFLVILH